MDNSPYESIYVDLEQTINNRDMKYNKDFMNGAITALITCIVLESLIYLIFKQLYYSNPKIWTLISPIALEKVL